MHRHLANKTIFNRIASGKVFHNAFVYNISKKMSNFVPESPKTLIEVHHLKESRSRRITWLLEELGLEYVIISYDRNPTTRLAPPELKAVHPLGKAPIIKDGQTVVFESGAIIEYLIRKYGSGRLMPVIDTPDYFHYLEFLHYAEGSAMLPLLLKLYTLRLGEAAAPLQPRISSEIQNHFGFLNEHLNGREWFVGNTMTGADINLAFAIQVAIKFVGRDMFPNLTAFADRVEALPSYRRAIEKGGE